MVKFENRVALNKVSRYFETAQLLVFFHGKKLDVLRKKRDSYNSVNLEQSKALLDDYNFSDHFLKRYVTDTPFSISTKAAKVTHLKGYTNKTTFCQQYKEDFRAVLIKNKHFEKLLFNILSNHIFEKKESRLLSKLFGEKKNNFSHIQDKINSDSTRANNAIKSFDSQSSKIANIKGTRFALFFQNFSNELSSNSNFTKTPERINNLTFLKNFFDEKKVKNTDETLAYKMHFSFPVKESKNASILGGFYKNRFIDHNQIKCLVDDSGNNKIYYRLKNNLKQPSLLCFSQFYHCYKIINILNSLKNAIKTQSKK